MVRNVVTRAQRIGLAAALVLLLPGALGTLTQEPPPAGDLCGDDWVDCTWADPTQGPGLVTYPMAGSTLLELLKPHLDRETYALLEDLLGDVDDPPPVPLPPRPQEAGVAVEAHVNEKVRVGHGRPILHLKAHLEANASLSLVGHGGPADNEQIPCQDPRGCPDLVVDSSALAVGLTTTESFASDDCAVVEQSTQPGTRRLLRFTFTTPNVGDGDLVIGDPADHPEWFVYGLCHGHWHFREYADYRLWTPDGYVRWLDARSEDLSKTPAEVLAEHPELREEMVAGRKQGFCALDVRPYAPVDPPKYDRCEFNQGISRGWADEYGFRLDGQWIDITGVPPGAYVLEGEVNPERLYEEIDYANNAGSVLALVPPA